METTEALIEKQNNRSPQEQVDFAFGNYNNYREKKGLPAFSKAEFLEYYKGVQSDIIKSSEESITGIQKYIQDMKDNFEKNAKKVEELKIELKHDVEIGAGEFWINSLTKLINAYEDTDGFLEQISKQMNFIKINEGFIESSKEMLNKIESGEVK